MVASHKTLPTPRKQSRQKTNPLTEGVIRTLEQEFTKKNFSYVEKQCVELISQNPKAFFLYNILGLAQLEQGQYQLALENFNHTLQFTSDNVNIYQNIANAALQLGDTTQAVEAYKKVVKLTPEKLDVWKQLAIIYHDQKQFQEALDCLDSAKKYQAPNNSLGLSLMKLDFLIKLQKYESAEIEAKNILEYAPDNVKALINLGLIYNNLEQFEEGLEYCFQALSIEPLNPNASITLGTLLDNLDERSQAEEKLTEAISQNKSSSQLHFYMGKLLKNDRRFSEAVEYFKQAIHLQPDYFNAYMALGNTYYLLHKTKESLESFALAIDLSPTSLLALSSFAKVLKICTKLDNQEQYRKYIKTCLEHPDIDSTLVAGCTSSIILENLKNTKLTDLLSTKGLIDLNEDTDELLIPFLNTTIVTSIYIENIFYRVRYALLEMHANNRDSITNHPKIIELGKALSLQGFLNEYIWFISNQEKIYIQRLRDTVVNKIDNAHDVNIADLAILSMYEPLHKNEKITSWIKKLSEEAIGKHKIFYKKLFLEPALEKEISLNIKQYTSIDDDVSKAVQTQYEENPYPRWESVTRVTPENYTAKILAEVYPNNPRLDSNVKNPEILIAGCGTGRQPIYTALECISPNILAVDLSKASLSYAIRKASELSIKNIEFGHADILKLEELGRTFDLVESSGVLHHMEEPEKGLKVLLNILRPRGFLKLGLYSEIARKHIVDIKEQLDSNNTQMTTEEIRGLRKLIEKDNPEIHQKLCGIRDYFASSTFRDLILHVQEHRFTIPQLKRIINENNLEFMGFVLLNPATKKEYLEKYPDDQNCINLDNWHEFEKNNPNTFLSMYQFWCQKL